MLDRDLAFGSMTIFGRVLFKLFEGCKMFSGVFAFQPWPRMPREFSVPKITGDRCNPLVRSGQPPSHGKLWSLPFEYYCGVTFHAFFQRNTRNAGVWPGVFLHFGPMIPLCPTMSNHVQPCPTRRSDAEHRSESERQDLHHR